MHRISLGGLLVMAAFGWSAHEAAAADAQATAATQDPAYSLNLLYTGELWNNVRGGAKTGASYMHNIDGQFQVDTEKAFGWTGGRFYFEAFYANHVSSSAYVGSLDQISPIDTAAGIPLFRLYQVYYEQTFAHTNVRFGVYDLETEFGNTKPMALFLNKNLTWNTTFDQAGTMPSNGTIGPGNYPYTPLALRIRQDITDKLSLQFAVANGAADNPKHPASNGIHFSSAYGALFIGEASYVPIKRTRLIAGAWHMTSKLPEWGRFDPDGSQHMIWGQTGGYVGATTRLIDNGGFRGLDAFFTYGMATPQSTNVVRTLDAGLSYTGLFESRKDDKIGLAVNVNNASSYWKQMQLAGGTRLLNYETSFELTYRAKINQYLTVQPDIQYIIHPNYSPTTKNAFVFGVHFEIGRLSQW